MSSSTVLHDSWVEAERHLRIIPRNLELLMFATIQPIMFVVLFVYVFGGAIEVDGVAHDTRMLAIPVVHEGEPVAVLTKEWIEDAQRRNGF